MPIRKSTNRNAPKPLADTQADAEQQLNSFLAKYDPEVSAFARRALAKMRKLVPGAIEMVYDNYNWLVIGFSPTERPSEAIFSLVLSSRPRDAVLSARRRLARSSQAPPGQRQHGTQHPAV